MTIAVPPEIAPLRQWVAWRWEERSGKPTKPPYNARTGDYADSTDPLTWSSLDEALDAGEHYDGIGFVLTDGDPYAGIDLDKCRDAQTGVVESWAREIVEALNSYTEVTPSGTGLRVFVRGVLPPGGRKRGHIELYDRARYLTVTGQHVAGMPRAIEDRTDALRALHAKIFPPMATASPMAGEVTPVDVDDEDLIQRAETARNGDRFFRLWRGEILGASHSEADLALCNHLAFWTGRDASRMDRLFRRSGLMRPKWDERHGAQTYGAMTIAKAIASCGETYTPRGERMAVNGTRAVISLAMTEATPLRVPDGAVLGIARDFADLYAEYLETPRSFLYFSLLTYLGALMAKKITLASAIAPEPRLYTVLLGESADTRKSTSLRVTDEFLRSLGVEWEPRVLYGVGSAEGIAAELKERSDLLLHFDEFKSFVDKAKNENSIALPMVATLFERSEFDNRTKAERLSVRGASLSLLAACTIDTYATMFDQRFFSIGLLNRLWLVTDRTTRRIAVPKPIPHRDLDALRERVRAVLEAVDRAYVRNGLRPVAYLMTPDAEEIFRTWYEAKGGSIFERRLDTYGHRLMVLLAATSGRTIVDAIVAEAVIALLGYQLEVRRECDPVDAENSIAAMEEKIRRALTRGSMKRRELQRKVHSERWGLWVWNTATMNLIRAGEIQHDRATDTFWLLLPVTASVPTLKNGISANGDGNY